MKSYSDLTILQFNRSILEDEFNDELQNADIYEGNISGLSEMDRLLDVTELQSRPTVPKEILNVGSGQASLEPMFPPGTIIINLEPAPSRSNENTIEGWSENIVTEKTFDAIICWGVLCFVRSLPETLIEFNRVLRLGGRLIVDTVSYSTMPLPQTVQPDCFIRYMKLYGFELEERRAFGYDYHKRVGYRFMKQSEFNFKRLRMPQCGSKINNYLPERDWFMR